MADERTVPTSKVAFALAVCWLLLTSLAHAEAPSRAELRAVAERELAGMMPLLAEADRARLRGTYLAFDDDPTDAFAQVACDDDGDHVVVVSDAMLDLAGAVAWGASTCPKGASSASGDRAQLTAYARFLAHAQVPGRWLVPPPAGFYETADGGAAPEVHAARLAETIAFVIARELARLRAGDLVCPRPTPAREAGDGAWTEAERRAAIGIAARVYPGDDDARDREAGFMLLARDHTETGAHALLSFLARLEAEARFAPSYVRHHPRAAARIPALEALRAVREARAARRSR